MRTNYSLDYYIEITNNLLERIIAGEELSILEYDILKENIRILYSRVLIAEKQSNAYTELQEGIKDIVSLEKAAKEAEFAIEPQEKIAIEQEERKQENVEEKEIISDIIEGGKIRQEIKQEKGEETGGNNFISFHIEQKEDIKEALFSLDENSEEKVESEADVPKMEQTSDDEFIIETKFNGSKAVTIAEHLSDISETPITIGDSISVNNNTIGSKISHEKVASIKSSIGINDKFYFINKLFDGDVKTYNELIDKFDNFTSYNDAKILIQLLINKYSWDIKEEAFTKFELKINRKFD